MTEFSFPMSNLSIYNETNYTGRCIVSFYKHDKMYGNLIVYIVNVDHCFEMNLYDERETLLENVPPPGEVFSVDLGSDGLHRAVCNEHMKLLFIDSGEIIQISPKFKFKMYSLSERAQKMSARGIPCKVIEVLDEFEKPINDDMFNIISLIVHQEIWFTVHYIDKANLVVTLRKMKPVISKKDQTTLQLTKEEVDMLYEEPEMITSNALKAILGHVPRDEKLICPFYDENTGACFKGNTCHLLHVAPIEDGLTRDRKETKYKILDQTKPKIGLRYKIAVTCIQSVDEFFAYIPEISVKTMSCSLEEFKDKMNSISMVEQYQPLVASPNSLDLVLIKHKGIFRRGKVIEDHGLRFLIFFIDIGSMEMIDRKNIFQWDSRWESIPALAYRCFVENIRMRKKNDTIAIEALRNLILNGRDISAQIMSYDDDLWVRIFDENGSDIGETLYANEFAILATRPITITTRIPG